jgi:Asp-tRNA(Asn)/Glu-tRNA(Gln) amidotransferase B subunit
MEVDKEKSKIAWSFMVNELAPRLKKKGLSWEDCPIPPRVVSGLIDLKMAGILSHAEVRKVLDLVFKETSVTPEILEIIERLDNISPDA